MQCDSHVEASSAAPPLIETEPKSEARYRSLFENSPISLWDEDFSAVKAYLDRLVASGIEDLDAFLSNRPDLIAECARLVRVRDVNRATLRLFEIESKEGLLNGLQHIFEEDSLDQFKLQLLAISRGEISLESEVVNRTLKGRRLQCSLRWSVQPGCETTFSRVIVSLLDVTEQRRVERELHLFAHTLRSVGECVSITDMSDNLCFVNEAFVRTYGFTEDELVGKNIRMVRSPHTPAEVTREILPATLRGGWSGEVLNRRKDGSDFPIDLSTSIVRNESRQPTHLVGIARDITGQKQAELALRASEEKYRRFFEENLSGVYIASPEGRLLACNPTFVRIFGFETPAEAVGTDMAAFYPNPGAWTNAVQLLSSNKKLERCETELRRKDGQPVFVVKNMFGEFDDRGRLLEIRGYVFDDTDRKKLEEQFRQSQKMEAVGRLAGGIAHDFNNLLTCINGYAELLVSELDRSSPQRKFAEEIQSSGERAAQLTNQLLSFSRRQVPRPELLCLNHVVRSMDQMLRRLIGEDIQLGLDLDPLIGAVQADPGQISQVIMNLVINARDAMPDGGRLNIHTAAIDLDEGFAAAHDGARPGPHIMLAVSDTGCGMSAKDRLHLFEPFYTTKEIGKGTGLGLSIVYGIVKQSGGCIRVSSCEGVGSTFSLFFPCSQT
jgi:PAS domain S-box-containing protein